MYYNISSGSSYAITFNLGTSIYNQTWHHLVLVGNVTSTNTITFTLYLDNVSKITSSAVAYASETINANNFYIGKRADSLDRRFNGYIDNFRFYTIPLTTTNINNLYTNGI